MKFGVVVFPGSNCDMDIIHVLQNVLKQEVYPVWHKESNLDRFSSDDCIVLPGGFSYGDYLRPGAIARFSPVMNAISGFANSGGLILGVCNGFQILCELGLLPGVLLMNESKKFICKNSYIRVETSDTLFTSGAIKGQALKIPIAHADGRYYADAKTLDELNQNDQVLFRYCDEAGNIRPGANVNGSAENIAGICNIKRNVFGMMPHPERASEEILGNTDGKILMQALTRFSKVEV